MHDAENRRNILLECLGPFEQFRTATELCEQLLDRSMQQIEALDRDVLLDRLLRDEVKDPKHMASRRVRIERPEPCILIAISPW